MDDIENLNTNFEKDMKMEQLRVEVLKKFDEYNTILKFMVADAPLSVLCLSNGTEKILIDNGFLRIYDLFDVDFIKIKGLGVSRIRDLTTRLDQFFSML
jgi:hypothetical protein